MPTVCELLLEVLGDLGGVGVGDVAEGEGHRLAGLLGHLLDQGLALDGLYAG